MTTAPPEDKLGAIIARTRHLLLDFDGPICSIFAGLPAPAVADRLRKVIPDDVHFPKAIADTSDPMEVFTWSATVSAELAERIEAELTTQEVNAVATAEPTPYVHEVIAACRDSGRSLAVVSNNSARAVRAYLVRHSLDDRIQYIVARTAHDPALLKPSPHLIEQAVKMLSAESRECVLVGDSRTDIEAARVARVQSVGYANKPGKYEQFVAGQADAVIDSLADLAIKLRARFSSS